MKEFPYEEVEMLVEAALAEDIGPGDITTQSLFDRERISGAFVAREAGVLCGMGLVRQIIARHAAAARLERALPDGTAFEADTKLASLTGPAVEILPLERLLLNFLQRLSGIATTTRRYVQKVAGTRARVYDTRKTTPGWRKLEKYAVRTGGAENHRRGLFDAVLVKDNHIALARKGGMSLAGVIRKVRSAVGSDVFVEVEVDSLADLDEALREEVDAVLLDNMTVEELASAVAKVRAAARRIELEASGGVQLDRIRRIAETGVERISVGALTHSAVALDIAFDPSFPEE